MSEEEHSKFRDQQCKGPEIGLCLVCWKYSKEAIVAGAELSRGRIEEDKIRKEEGKGRV